MFASFTVTLGHALSKELSGGRVRVRADETIAEAVGRRVAQDTRCRVLEMKPITPEDTAEGGAEHYEIRLNGWVIHASHARTKPSEGTIRVRVVGGPLGPATIPAKRKDKEKGSRR